MSDKKEATITVNEANALLADLVSVLERAIEEHGTHDLETIASLCCLPYELLLRLLRLLGSEQTTEKSTANRGDEGQEPDREVLTEQEQQLLRLWREAATPGSDELSISQDLALLILKRRH